MGEIVQVVAGILNDDQNRTLLMRRQPSKVPEWSCVWCHAGGKLNPGETPEDALVREWFEELGQEIKVISPCVYQRGDISSSGVHYNVRWYLVESLPGAHQPRLSEEAIAIGWWTREEALMLPMTPGGREVLVATWPLG
jgi:ADP-ribose pyrophosphatase YjhB (NUDIX family)